MNEIEADASAEELLCRLCSRINWAFERRDMRNAVLGTNETYRGPVEDLPELRPEAESKAHGLPTRQIWIGRDDDLALYQFPSQPTWTGSDFVPRDGERVVRLPEEWFPEIEPGFCQAFVKQGPRVDKRVKPNDAAT